MSSKKVGSKNNLDNRLKESGNVFLALFGAIAMIGIIGASTMTLLKGPVKTMSMVTKRTIAENSMIAAGKLALIAAAAQADNDCDSDLFVEPIPFGNAISGFTGGGKLPSMIGVARQDPWGGEYAYCAWDHGTIIDDAACGGAGQNRLQGANAETEYTLAIISAGPDGVFSTSCNDYSGPNTVLTKTSGADDLVLGYTYGEAGALSGGLWELSDPDTAKISKDLSITDVPGGTETFAFDSTIGDLTIGGSGKFPVVNTDNLRRFSGIAGGTINVDSALNSGYDITTSADISGNDIAASGDVTVTGNVTTASGTISAATLVSTANTTVGGTLGVTGTSTLGTVNAGATGVTTLSVSGATDFDTTLNVDGAATLDSLAVTNAATVGGTLDVTGTSTLNTVNAGATSTTTLSSSGTATLDSLDVTNAATIGDTLDVTGATTLTTLGTSGDASIGGELDMTGNKIINLGTPTANADATTKAYVDAHIAAGTGFTETDPEVGDISTSGKWCYSDGTKVVCDRGDPTVAGNGDNLGDHIADQDLDMADFDVDSTSRVGFTGVAGSVPVTAGGGGGSDTLAGLSCTDGQVASWNGSAWVCADDDTGGDLVTTLGTPDESQSIATNGAFDWESFVIDGETYLALANNHNGTTRNINSKIYKWNGTSFAEIQSIATNGAVDWESFVIGGETYLALANHHNDTTYNINSKIYKWNGTSFAEIQSIATNGAIDWESFVIGGETYLALANLYNDTTYNINSKIYKWNGTSFAEIQSIATNGVHDWESFVIGGETYLALANHHNDTTRNINSKIYKWNGTSFAEIQSIATNGAIDWESFVIGGETYLALTNHHNDTTYNINSKVYKWNGTSFAEIQSIATNGARDWESFVIGGETYLALANHYNGTTRNINSKIYKWNGTSFAEIQSIATNGAVDWESFVIGGETYLALANLYNDTTYNINSKIYRMTLVLTGLGDGSGGGNDTLANLSCASNEIAKWNGSAWACATDGGGGSGDNLGDHTATTVLSMSTNKITNVVDPTAAQDAATKAYVDSLTGPGTGSGYLTDADSDTLVQVEESADEDIIRFDTAGSERMVIDENGNVGIGTTSPNDTLELNRTAPRFRIVGSTPILRLRDTSKAAGSQSWQIQNNNGLYFGTTVDDFSAWQNSVILHLARSGNVGIGITPSYKLHVNGTAYATGAAGALSDLRHKDNIKTLNDGALDTILRLRPVTFEWKEALDIGMKGTQLGFIAQEVEKVLPSMVLTQDNEEKTKGLKSTELLPVLTKAIQELKAENDALKAQNNTILKRLEALEKQE